MSKLIAGSIKDPSLRSWILPCFTTTTKLDQAVASILMMATLQKYFNYSYDCTTCGLPSVTLLGSKSDWATLATKAQRLEGFGEESKLWYTLLKPVLAGFVRSFDEPDRAETLDFWRKMAKESGGSGGTDLDVSFPPSSSSGVDGIDGLRVGSQLSASGICTARCCITRRPWLSCPNSPYRVSRLR